MKLKFWQWFAAVGGGLLAINVMITIWGPLI